MSHFNLRNLRDLTLTQVLQNLATIPANTTSLDLSCNHLSDYIGVQLAQAFAAFPVSLSSLNLGYNRLYKKNGAELALSFKAIPPTVTSLKLHGNKLYIKTADELVQAFRAIQPSVTSLDLSYNSLYKKTGTELAQALSALPPKLNSLDLSGNFLGNTTVVELSQVFQAIPASVTSLNLSENNLGFNGAKAIEALATLPSSVTTLNLSDNNFEINSAQFHNLLAVLPAHVQSVILDNKTINMIEYRAEELIQQVNEQIIPRKSLLGFDFLIPFKEIDEVRLPHYINVLEQKNTSLALLTCGLILAAGRIETTIEVPYGPYALNQYLEKRVHDAISFYTKAAQDLNLKPLIDFIVWELKTTTDILSVQQRLASYDVSPTKNDIESYKEFNTPKVSIPIPNNYLFFLQANNLNDNLNETESDNMGHEPVLKKAKT